MSTSHPKSPPESNKTPSGPTRPAMDGLHVEFSPPGRDASPAPDLASGAVLCNRYRIDRSLGKGGFGGVYLALDLDLGRKVAIKRQLGRHLQDNELARNEAKFIAGLDHPSIVKVFDLIDDEKEGVLIIMEYVNGYTLHELLRRKRLSESRALELAAEIAQSLIHAHSRRIVHRDLKPSNVLLDPAEKVKLSDFGLALGAINYETAPSAAGTPKYMAPEQIRGESHRIDGRTDIWSLGVILYEMLTGSLPFTGPSRGATFESILHDEPTPPRQLNPRVPEALEHIVMRCLRKRMSERPISASDLLDDLKACQSAAASIEVDTGFVGQPMAFDAPDSRSARSASPSGMLQVEPKGLRPYSEEDGVHFLELIPGPRERSGLPESIHFWRKWASCDNVDEYASVGVLYGPSGAGKTSFVRAGLINQLDNDICPIFIECRSGDLARRIEAAIRNRFHQKPQSGSLSKLLSGLRNEEGGIFGYRKILLILDQFEAWSTSATTEDRRALAEALRHCDGKTLQSLFVVRDDYWSGITEIMQWIDVPLIENRNVRSLELLDPRHAQRVLEGMGRAHGTLPRAPEPLSDEQQKFIRQAIEGMSNNDRVVAVHLVMFAQIVRVLPWTPQVLRKQGGVEGACSAYLHEIFETSSGPPAYRRISGVVADILSELLPAQGDPLRASAKSIDELRARVLSGGASAKVTDAVRVLSEDLKLITPTRADTGGDSISSGGAEGYQLAHDFLVEPVRRWVELARKSTWRGRAVARLVELSELWQRRPQTQFLPTLREFAAMQFVVPNSSRNEKQTKFLRAAGRYHAGKAAGMTIATVVAIFFGLLAIQQYSERTEAERLKLVAQANLLVHGKATEVPRLLDELGREPNCLPVVNALLESVEPRVQLRAGLLAQRLGKASFASVAAALENAEPELFETILKGVSAAEAKAALLAICDDEKTPLERKSRAAILLLYAGDDQPVSKMLAMTEDCTQSNSVIMAATQWRSGTQPWIDLLESANEPGTTYHTLAILGSFKTAELGIAFPWPSVDAIRRSDNPMLISAAEWLMRQNSVAMTPLELSNAAGAQRIRSPLGVELQRINAGTNAHLTAKGEPRTLEFKRDLWVSVGPIERRIYDQFVSEVKSTADGKPFPPLALSNKFPDSIRNHPERAITGIDISQAFQLCNWLSDREGLRQVYSYEGKQSYSERGQTYEYDKWKRNPDAAGYRLPTTDEFKYLAYGGVNAGFPWEIVLRMEETRSGYQMEGLSEHPRLARDILPNRFGLHCFELESDYWLESERLFPTSFGILGNGFYGPSWNPPGPDALTTMLVLRR